VFFRVFRSCILEREEKRHPPFEETLDFETGSYVDPSAAQTTSETTSRYQDDGRVQFTTRWKSARGQIDPQNPPIAGMNGVAIADGVTTQYVYLKEFSSTASKVITRLGGSSATININAALNKLKLAPSSGGASVTFSSGGGGGGFGGGGTEEGGATTVYALGSATVVISPDEKTMQVAISDGAGRNVMNALMSGPAATTPYQLLDWGCTQFDQTYTLSGYGTTNRTNQVDPAGKLVSSMTDGFGWNVASMDEDSNLSRNKHDSGGNVLEQIDPLSHSVTHAYDALGRRTSTTSFAGTTSTSYNNTTGRVVSPRATRPVLRMTFWAGRPWSPIDWEKRQPAFMTAPDDCLP
jgi:YD repeat-containing protein